jgi:hypothetical protein
VAVKKKTRRVPPPAPRGNKYAVANNGGRPTDYRPEFVEQVRKLCQLGATDAEVADFFNVSRMTIYRWRAAYPEFCDSMKAGKAPADDRMERSFYERGIGYDYKIKPGYKHVPGDVTVQMKWLCNRRPERWREKIDVTMQREPEKSAAEIRAEIVAKLIEWGVRIVPDDDYIDGEAVPIPALQKDDNHD